MTRDEAFAVLGLPAGAPKRRIDKNYRKMAFEHHPDRGGDEAAFKLVQEAYNLLTGRGERCTTPPDPELVAANQLLGECLACVLVQMCEEYKDPERVDVVRLMNLALDNAREGHTQGMAKQKKLLAHLNKARGHFKTEGENLLEAMLDSRVASCAQQVSYHGKVLKNLRRAKVELARYRYEFTAALPGTPGAVATPTVGEVLTAIGRCKVRVTTSSV